MNELSCERVEKGFLVDLCINGAIWSGDEPPQEFRLPKIEWKRKKEENYQSSFSFIRFLSSLICMSRYRKDIPKECKLKMNILFSSQRKHCTLSLSVSGAFYLDWNENGAMEEHNMDSFPLSFEIVSDR
jgi:hypothetical protein